MAVVLFIGLGTGGCVMAGNPGAVFRRPLDVRVTGALLDGAHVQAVANSVGGQVLVGSSASIIVIRACGPRW